LTLQRYGEFEHNAELDGRVRPVSFALKGNVVTATVPHFWFSMGIPLPSTSFCCTSILTLVTGLDPNYQILLDTKPNCHSNNSLLLLEIILPIALVFVAILAILGALFVLPRARVWCATRQGRRMVHKKNEDEMENLEINKVHSYEVNSSAGNFNLRI
jgi:hypothetical protein